MHLYVTCNTRLPLRVHTHTHARAHTLTHAHTRARPPALQMVYLDATPDYSHVPMSACRIKTVFPQAKIIMIMKVCVHCCTVGVYVWRVYETDNLIVRVCVWVCVPH